MKRVIGTREVAGSLPEGKESSSSNTVSCIPIKIWGNVNKIMITILNKLIINNCDLLPFQLPLQSLDLLPSLSCRPLNLGKIMISIYFALNL